MYSPPSRKLLTTKLLRDEYKIIVSKLKNMLKSIDYVSITTDMLYDTSDSNKTYVTITGHFIFENKLYSPVFATREVHEAYTGEILLLCFQIFLKNEI